VEEQQRFLLAAAALGLPVLVLLAARRGGPRDPVPAGESPPDPLGAIRAVLWVLLVFLGAGTVGAVLGVAGAGEGGTAARDRSPLGLIDGLLVDASLKVAAIAGVLLVLPGTGPRPAPRPAPWPRAAGAGLLAALAFLPVLVVLLLVQEPAFRALGIRTDPQAIVTKALEVPASGFLAIAAFSLVAAPATEEVVFRGFLYPGLRARLGRGAATVLSAAAFALIHGEPAALPTTFALGLFLADLRERPGGLAAPIAMHAGYNAVQVAGILIARSGT